MHGAPGFQSNDPSCGKVNASELFDCSLAGLKCRQRTADLWQALARHFRGNPAVAAFDLFNEPMNGFSSKDKSDCRLWHLYNKLYKAVRAADPNRMITVQGIREMENLPTPKHFCWQNIVYHLHIYNGTKAEIDQKIADINSRASRNVPVFIGECRADGLWDYTLSAFNENILSWCTWTYKGVKTQTSDRFLFTGEIEVANLQEDSFEEIKAKWGKLCRTSESFAENTELAAIMKKYLTGQVEPVPDTTGTKPTVTVEVYSADEKIPDTGNDKSSDPVKIVFGSATLVGLGTLAGLTKKKEE
jgi:endoglucanase